MKVLITLSEKLETYIEGKYAVPILFWLSCIESVFSPIPPDALLAPMSTYRKEKWAYYALITTAGSILGALFGYAIGVFFFDLIAVPIIDFYNLSSGFEKIEALYQEHAFWTVFTAGFTLIPYKVFTISAGLFKINFALFLLASVIGRGMRYFLVSYLFARYGKQVGEHMFKNLNIIILLALFAVILLLFFL